MLVDANDAAVGGTGEDDGLAFIARIAATVPVNLDGRGDSVRKHRGSPEELDILLAAPAFKHTPATVSYTHLTLPTKRIV